MNWVYRSKIIIPYLIRNQSLIIKLSGVNVYFVIFKSVRYISLIYNTRSQSFIGKCLLGRFRSLNLFQINKCIISILNFSLNHLFIFILFRFIVFMIHLIEILLNLKLMHFLLCWVIFIFIILFIFIFIRLKCLNLFVLLRY